MPGLVHTIFTRVSLRLSNNYCVSFVINFLLFCKTIIALVNSEIQDKQNTLWLNNSVSGKHISNFSTP